MTAVRTPFLCSPAALLRLPRVACLLLAFAACLLVAPAQADTREDALEALSSSDAAQRRQAVLALGDSGTLQDADRLLDALHDEDGGVRKLAEQSVWRVWTRSGDAEVDALMQAGMRQMQEGRLGLAVDTFTRIIEKRPDFAEGWNKRATVYFLIGDYDQSLKDCDETLQRNPNHFGALSGCGAMYAQREELERALEYLERALEVNPNLDGIEQGVARVRHRLGQSGKRSI
jgi:tetratricopeptide (TPR) repeat protein